jgi:hypothetical protein
MKNVNLITGYCITERKNRSSNYQIDLHIPTRYHNKELVDTQNINND